jgi:hypothetical protein
LAISSSTGSKTSWRANDENKIAFGLRRQSGSGDGAFARSIRFQIFDTSRADESGVALRLPPQSKFTAVIRMPAGLVERRSRITSRNLISN